MKTTGIIRDRGQLTIPESLRKKAYWLDNLTAVNMVLTEDSTLVITPHTKNISVSQGWDALDEAVQLARTFKIKKTPTSQDIISKDRKRLT